MIVRWLWTFFNVNISGLESGRTFFIVSKCRETIRIIRKENSKIRKVCLNVIFVDFFSVKRC